MCFVMKKLNFRWLIATILALLLISMHSCTTRRYKIMSGFTQGTTFRIIYSDDIGGPLDDLVDKILTKIDFSMSVYNKESIISAINRGDEVELDTLFINVFNRSLQINKKSEGLFDPSASPLFNLWGFGFKNREEVNQGKIDSLKAFCGMDNFILEGHRIIKRVMGAELNFNAIAKGYTSDVIAMEFDKIGIGNYLIEIGGEIKCKGKNISGDKWSIGIDKPKEGNFVQGGDIQDVLLIENCGLATSGNYRSYYEENGEKFSHTINPLTGYPARNNLLSATIIAPDAMTADAYATWFMVAGLEKAIEIIESEPDIEGYLIYSEGDSIKTYKSEGIKIR